MKIGKYIFEILPNPKPSFYFLHKQYIRWRVIPDIDSMCNFKQKECKHIKPNTGIRYKIIGFYCGVLIIKQLN